MDTFTNTFTNTSMNMTTFTNIFTNETLVVGIRCMGILMITNIFCYCCYVCKILLLLLLLLRRRTICEATQ